MLKWLFIKLCFVSFAWGLDCQKRLFDISIKEALSLEESLAELASYCTFSIVIKDDFARNKLAQMQTSVHISQMGLEEIFRLFIKENDLNYAFDGKILSIWGISTKIFKISYITSIREGQSVIKASVDSKPKQSEWSAHEEANDNVIKSMEKFDFWQNIEKEVNALLASHKAAQISPPIVNANAGIIIVTGSPSQLNLVRDYLAKLERRLKKQVIIDVSIIAVNLNKSHSSGINWQNFKLDFASTTGDGQGSFVQVQSGEGFVKNLGLRANLNFGAVLDFLSQNGKTQVLSNPKLMALNNQQAIISVGDTINYQVKESSKGTESGTTVSESFSNHSIFVGILLSILPEISDEGRIMLRINPSLSDFKYPQDNQRQKQPRTIAPDTIQKKLSTVVSVENNQTLILGGLISRNAIREGSEVNFFSKIPLLGLLFSGDEQASNSTEIIFIITPSIVDNEKGAPGLRELGFKHYE
ncbi:pilus (MSHA type) biogenesis protein MshL [Campylobacter sp.]|uniref:pilus (MSHA type) biogenesis protein MshL n=1 Tax=Campylobacter sp. TaxID=205 RepID=UPI0026DBFDED|nr:pilus (MSHA type) biogenesis protein MshL [Campylobacter sp.]MDO4674101.1 pilus (MSHA type) biogenesis protein MshL [Campylobacter sp.]